MTEAVPSPAVVRFEVINHCDDPDRVFISTGSRRMMIATGVHVAVSYQDEGHTLKIFLTDGEADGQTAA